MKSLKLFQLLILTISLFLFTKVDAQLAFAVNSLADDAQSYPYDDPDTTPFDESTDGICADELGRCTIRAAVDEANYMSQSLNLTFSVSGLINLLDVLYIPDGSSINGNNQITLSAAIGALVLEDNSTVQGLRFENCVYYAVNVAGSNNSVGVIGGNYNEIVNCYVGIIIEGENNKVYNNFIGITFNDVLMPNAVGIMVIEGSNYIGKNQIGASNVICGNTNAGITLNFADGNIVAGNYIGTNISGQTGMGNTIGIVINSNNNLIGGNDVLSTNVISGNSVGISISGAPPDTYADENLIVNNIIGLSGLQDAIVPNNNGISITNGVTNAKIYDNIISGNTATGIGIFGYDAESYTSGHLIYGNKIGVDQNAVHRGNGIAGIYIAGNVENVTIGTDEINNYLPNIIVGNDETGIDISTLEGFSPNEIVFRKNLIYQNALINLYVDSLSNLGFKSPFGLSINGNTLSGSHLLPGMIIDVYKANEFELAASAYEWLGSTTTNANGIFSFVINDTSVNAVAVTATSSLAGVTSKFAKLSLLVTDIENEKSILTEFVLEQNYPNPFNQNTTIKYGLPVAMKVRLEVHNILGQPIATLVNAEQKAGYHEVVFQEPGLPGGVYFYRLQAGDFVETKNLILLR